MKIALVELDDSPHDVNLYSQIKFLKSVNPTFVALICSKALEERLVCYQPLVDKIHLVQKKLNFWGIIKLRNLIIAEGFDKVIFNTAHGNQIKILLSFPFPKSIEFLGVLHYPDKLEHSNSQKMISKRVKKYFLLNDYLLQDLKHSPKLNIQTTYFIYYPELKTLPVQKKEGEVWICVPGAVEFNRRDYVGLIQSIGKIGLDKKIKFILLGNSQHKNGDGTPLKQMLAEFGLQDNFMLWNSFVGLEEFYSYIRKSDYIMPLIHPDHESFNIYKNQISGSYNLAFGFKKMLLMENSFRDYSDFKANAIFYSMDNIADTVNGLQIPQMEDLYTENKWAFDFQANKYWELINAH